MVDAVVRKAASLPGSYEDEKFVRALVHFFLLGGVHAGCPHLQTAGLDGRVISRDNGQSSILRSITSRAARCETRR
jgi:hypothetical protein